MGPSDFTTSLGSKSLTATAETASDSVSVTVVEITLSSISADHIGTDESGQEIYATNDEGGDVNIVLQVNPSGVSLPANYISWTGGSAGASQLERTVSVSTLQTSGVDVKAEVDGASIFDAKIYIFPGPDVNEDLEVVTNRSFGSVNFPPNSLGAVDRNGAITASTVSQPVLDYYYESGEWKFVLVRLEYTLPWGVRSLGLTDVTDPNANPFPLGLGMSVFSTESEKRNQAFLSLYPNAQGIPLFYGYYSSSLVFQHEIFHMDDWSNNYFDPEMVDLESDFEDGGIDVDLSNIDDDPADIVSEYGQVFDFSQKYLDAAGRADDDYTGNQSGVHEDRAWLDGKDGYEALANSIPL